MLDQALAIAHRIGVPSGAANFLVWLSTFAGALETERGTGGEHR